MLRSPGNLLNVFLPVALLLVFATLSSPSWGEPIGRLFFTPDERTHLDHARLAGGNTEQESAPTQQQENLTLNGIVKRSSGKITVWVNHAVLNETHFPPGTKMLARKSRPPEFPVLVQKTGNTVTLKVGQTLNIDSGEIRESYQPSAAVETSATQASGPRKANNG